MVGIFLCYKFVGIKNGVFLCVCILFIDLFIWVWSLFYDGCIGVSVWLFRSYVSF